MAGGIGSRFWPVSRASYPKQFHDLLGTGRSMLQATADRFARLVPTENIYVVAHQHYTSLVREQLPQLQPHQILAEPAARNTAPCIAYATYKILAADPKASIVVSPSDHLILNQAAFEADVELGLAAVHDHPVIVTLGIHPTRPDTGYGYIQYKEDEQLSERVHRVKTFVEKPILDMAKTFVASGDFVWNSGLFLFSAKTMTQALAAHLPDLADLFQGFGKALTSKKETAFVAGVYAKCKNISIDIGVMEKASNIYLIRADLGWSDLGTWNSLYQQMPKDTQHNASVGEVLYFESQGNIVRSLPGRPVVLRGVKDLIVVQMDDVLLICDRHDEQSIREITAEMNRRYGDRFA